MMILEHERGGRVVVLADDKGLESPMVRDAAGDWTESIDAAPEILDHYVQVRDKGKQNTLLKAAFVAYSKIHKLAIDTSAVKSTSKAAIKKKLKV